MKSILDTIVAKKQEEVQRAKQHTPLQELVRRFEHAPPVRDFAFALAGPGPIKLIAEVKKASPSAGLLRDPFDPVGIATIYQNHGARAISVLTDEFFFQGRLEDLSAIRAKIAVPLLRKDFLIDVYQVYEARAAGADAVLLIAEILEPDQLRHLIEQTHALGMEALVEFYEPENLSKVLDCGARVVGINNRDLRNFQTDLAHTLALRERIPERCILVSESGIKTREDVLRLQQAGVHAILVGEILMRRADVGACIDELLAHPTP